MLAGQTAGPNWLTFLREHFKYPGGNKGYKIGFFLIRFVSGVLKIPRATPGT